VLAASGIEWDEPQPGTFVAVLPGEHKLRTTVSLVVGRHSMTVNAFVVRHPDENRAEFFGWLLRQNAKHPGLAFGIDPLDDVYLVTRLPVDAVTDEVLDAVLGQVLQTADGAFNTLLELGFTDSIVREWKWRVSRGESLANLAAFKHLVEGSSDSAEPEASESP